jgi:hypothetical protein
MLLLIANNLVVGRLQYCGKSSPRFNFSVFSQLLQSFRGDPAGHLTRRMAAKTIANGEKTLIR